MPNDLENASEKDNAENASEKDSIKKHNEEKKRIELGYFNLLVLLIKEEAFLYYRLLNNPGTESSEKEAFLTNINHSFSLLTAAYQGIKNKGPSPHTDYLITSALSHIADYLSAESVKNIVNKLDEFNKNNNKRSHSLNTENPSQTTSKISSQDTYPESSKKSEKEINADKSFNDLITRVSPILLSPAGYKANNRHKQIVIDFAADKRTYREYGIKRAKRLGADLIQVQLGTKFSAINHNFSIANGTKITLIGHCCMGSDSLSDNSGNRISARRLPNKYVLKCGKQVRRLIKHISQ